MDNILRLYPRLAAGIVGAIVMLALMLFIRGCDPQPAYTDRISIRTDTVKVPEWIIVPAPAPIVVQAPARVQVLSRDVVTYVDSSSGHPDTVLRAQPFTARLDTVINHDTISARMDFPPPSLSVMVRQSADSLLWQTREIVVTRTEIRDPPWYEKAGYVCLGLVPGAIGGYVIGVSR